MKISKIDAHYRTALAKARARYEGTTRLSYLAGVSGWYLKRYEGLYWAAVREALDVLAWCAAQPAEAPKRVHSVTRKLHADALHELAQLGLVPENSTDAQLAAIRDRLIEIRNAVMA
jgi:hypothetical protein